MASRIIEQEVQQALNCIKNEQNFILTGGAGSGKTYSLVSLIEEIGNRYPLKSVICITYTNNAVAEIRSRITNNKLRVSTIHEFLWSIISNFQTEIKETLIELINSKEHKIFRLPKNFDECQELKLDYFNNIRIIYDEIYNLRTDTDTTISHDHVLVLAEKMFSKYTKLCDILKDTSQFIFVDEYQDTDPLVIDILLKHLAQSSKKNIIGFFGDSMQAIYDNGVGAITNSSLIRINKKQNRRNPRAILELANKLRDDGIEQIPSMDFEAPNMHNGEIIQGNIKFVYADSIKKLDVLRSTDVFKEWDFSDSKKTKELWLVHKSNAGMADFKKLFEVYNSDLIVEIIAKIQKKINDEQIDTSNKSFQSIAEEVNICVRGRSRENLLENIKLISEYKLTYDWIKDKSWSEVCNIRVNKDSLLSYKFNGIKNEYQATSKRDKILCHLDSIYELMELYRKEEYNEFLRKTRQKIFSLEDKNTLNDGMSELLDENLSIGQITDKAKIILNTQNDSFEEFTTGKGLYLWKRIKELPFKEYVNSIKYQKEHLPFATQHSTKGSEFDNVLVVLDNGKWNKYNFEKMFKNYDSSDTIVQRTKKLFYVCCTRAKLNLVVFMPTTDNFIIEEAEKIFGKENVYPPVK